MKTPKAHLSVESLDRRDLPSATLLGSTLLVVEQGAGNHSVSIDAAGQQITVSEYNPINPFFGFNSVSSFNAAQVNNIVVLGTQQGSNFIQNNTSINSTLIGGAFSDTLFGGTGVNVIDPGAGDDVVYALLGTNAINTFDASGVDRVFTNFGASVNADSRDTVVRFFGPGRTPGSGFIGLDSTLNDGVLYITPTNNGSQVTLLPGVGQGSVVAVYNLGDGKGMQIQSFQGVKAISYFGGSGNDTYLNQTSIQEAAYGSAGDDLLIGGFGPVSVLKGSSGNDTLVGRTQGYLDMSGNLGVDVLLDLSVRRPFQSRHVFRAGPEDMVVGSMLGDVRFLS